MTAVRVVLDTNVLVAGLRSRRGASYRVLSALPDGRILALSSIPLFVEYEAALKRPEALRGHGLATEAVDALLDALAGLVEPVHLDYLWRPRLQDPNDEMVLETAINGGARSIVTFNVRDFGSVPASFGVELWSPQRLLQEIGETT